MCDFDSRFDAKPASAASFGRGSEPRLNRDHRERRSVVLSILLVTAVAAGQPNGCISCHGQTDSPTMHSTGTVQISCVDCHGGNASIQKSDADAKQRAHPKPKLPHLWPSSANPVRPSSDWLKEGAEYIRFVNPGDLRVVEQTC